MKTLTIAELSVDEAKKLLIDYYTDQLVNDRRNTRDMVAGGKLDILPNFATMRTEQIILMFDELALGDEIAKSKGVSHVVIFREKNGHGVWDIVYGPNH